jgi:hypothetical protein
MDNLDHISESLKKFFWVKIHNIFDVDPGWKKFGSGIRDGKKVRYGIPDKHPDWQH